MNFIKYPVRLIPQVFQQNVADSQFEEFSVVDSANRVLHYPAKRPKTPLDYREERELSEFFISVLNAPHDVVNAENNFCVEGEPVEEKPKRRGNPNWVKGYKQNGTTKTNPAA